MPDSGANFAEDIDPDDGSGSWSRSEIEAAIAGLDRATRKFTSRVESLNSAPAPAYTPPQGPARALPPPPASSSPAPVWPGPGPGAAAPAVPASAPTPAPRTSAPVAPPLYPPRERPSFDEQMREAEQSAREYLEQAKKRADKLVRTMIAAVEREAAEIRRDAENGIRERWSAVEIEAGRYLDDAREVADGMVAERQSVIGSLSDGIVDRAQSLTVGLDDAKRIQAQFDEFVRALARTSQQIADEAADAGEPEIAKLKSRARGMHGDALAA